jgi:hypothetical protein
MRIHSVLPKLWALLQANVMTSRSLGHHLAWKQGVFAASAAAGGQANECQPIRWDDRQEADLPSPAAGLCSIGLSGLARAFGAKAE